MDCVEARRAGAANGRFGLHAPRDWRMALRPGDEIRIEGVRDSEEPAGLDYVEIR